MLKKGVRKFVYEISAYISKVQGHFYLKFGRVPSVYEALTLLPF